IADSTGQAADVEAALDALGQAKSRAGLGWAIFRLLRLGRQAGLSAERQEQIVALLPASLNRWGPLELLRIRRASSRSVEPVEVVDKIPSDRLAHQVGLLELAWHNTYRSRSWARTVHEWDDGVKAFGALGIALGMQGR